MFRPCWSGWRTAIGLSHRLGDGNVVSSLHCMNDPQPEGHMASHIERRKFLATLGGAAASWPLAARAQQDSKVYRIGMLETTSQIANETNLNAFRERLRELGYVEGKNLAIDYRSADGRPDRFPALASELVGLKPDLITTRGTPAVLAAKNATSTIPVVMTAIGEPVEIGVVASVARPGGNITGLSSFVPHVASKRLELMSEMVRSRRRLGYLAEFNNGRSQLEWNNVQKAAQSLR